jgi:hypothetical protein
MVVIMVAGMVKTLILCAKFLVSECMASLCEVRLGVFDVVGKVGEG